MLQRAGRQVVQFRVRYPHETVQVGRQCPLYLAVSKDYQSVSKVYTLSHTFATCGRGQLTLLHLPALKFRQGARVSLRGCRPRQFHPLHVPTRNREQMNPFPYVSGQLPPL